MRRVHSCTFIFALGGLGCNLDTFGISAGESGLSESGMSTSGGSTTGALATVGESTSGDSPTMVGPTGVGPSSSTGPEPELTDSEPLPADGVCGNAIEENGEQCDDAAADDSGDCTTHCTIAVCGDGFVHDAGSGTEACDNGDQNGPGMACSGKCQLNVCGDGDKGPGEGCDDGNKTADDGCDGACLLETCGDMMVDPGEACDDGKNGDPDDGCTDACQAPACGDGLAQPSTGEQCDDGAMNKNTGVCTLACKDATCGDGYVQPGEACDDANNINHDSCVSCEAAACGDGFLQEDELCDDGDTIDNQNQYNKCSADCKTPGPSCGDGIVNGPESCEEGGPVVFDGTCNYDTCEAVCNDPEDIFNPSISRCCPPTLVPWKGPFCPA